MRGPGFTHPMLPNRIRHSISSHSWRELCSAAGTSAARTCIDHGDIVKLGPDRYASALHAESTLTRAHAAVAMVGPRAVLTGRAALALFMPSAIQPESFLVSAPPGPQRVVPRWVRIARRAATPEHVEIAGIRTAIPAWAVIGAYVEDRSDDAALFFALTNRIVRPDAVRDVMRELPRVTARRRIERVLNAFENGAESHLEMHGHDAVLADRRLRRVARQHRMMVNGERFRADAYDAATRTAIEFDGARFHTSAAQVEADKRRDLVLASIGIQTLRLTYRDVMERPAWCADLVAATLMARA
jgi:very-short-patch-repair endonuclease